MKKLGLYHPATFSYHHHNQIRIKDVITLKMFYDIFYIIKGEAHFQMGKFQVRETCRLPLILILIHTYF